MCSVVSTPQTSFDCSGFICWVYTQSGVCNLPRMTAYGIYLRCTPISASQAQPGDLVFFANTYDCPEPISAPRYLCKATVKCCIAGNPIGYADLSNRTGNHICMGLRALNKQQEVSMNWIEKPRNMMMTRSLSLRVITP